MEKSKKEKEKDIEGQKTQKFVHLVFEFKVSYLPAQPTEIF